MKEVEGEGALWPPGSTPADDPPGFSLLKTSLREC